MFVAIWACSTDGGVSIYASGQASRGEELEVRLEQLEEAALSDPDDARVRHDLGRVLQEIGELQRSIEEHRNAIRLSPMEIEYYLALADAFQAANLTEDATTLLARVTDAFGESVEASVALADARFQGGDVEEALAEFRRASRRATELNTDDGRAIRAFIYRRIGEMHVHLIQFDDALEAFEDALALSPDDTNLHLAFGRLYLRRNRLAEAIMAYETVVARDPLNQSAHVGIAEASLRMGRFDEATAAAEAAIQLDPQDLGAHYLRAMALIRAGREDKGNAALASYRILEAESRVRDQREREIGGVYKEALAQTLAGNGTEAIRILREGIEVHPDADELYLNLGLILKSLERYEEAIEVFERMSELELADSPLIRRSLAEARALLDDGDQQ